MSQWICSVCHESFQQTPLPEKCPSCGSDQALIIAEADYPKTLDEVRDRARTRLKGVCAAYPSCDGSFEKICQREAYGKPIGLGGAGSGRSFRANSTALEAVLLNLSVIGDHFTPDPSCTFLGIDLEFPVLASSTAGVEKYNDTMDETAFCISVLKGAKEAGTIGLRGDTWFYTEEKHPSLDAMAACNGFGIPIFKPRSQDVLKRLIERAQGLGCKAVGVDLDGCGSTIMARHGQPVFKKSARDIRELVEFSSLPFMAKGIMLPEEAEACVEAGAAVIGVSNHGGRVLDSTPGTAAMLPRVKERIGDSALIAVDGGVRTGYDVLKMLALGADVVMLGRDIIRAAVGGGTPGVTMHLEHVKDTLKKAMFMTGTLTPAMANERILFKEEPWEKS